LRAWAIAAVLNSIMATVAYYEYIQVPHAAAGGKPPHILDFNTGHEFWLPNHKDSHNIVHKFDSSPFPLFLIWGFLVQSVLLNGSCFVFLKLLSILMLEDVVGYIKSFAGPKEKGKEK